MTAPDALAPPACAAPLSAWSAPPEVAAAPRDEGRLRRPPAPALRISLFSREVRERLAASAVDLLFERARVLSEGGRAWTLPRADGGRAADPFFGSTMLTLDLPALDGLVREPALPAVAERVAALLVADARAGRRARQIAEREASRIAGGRVLVTAAEVRVRAVAATVEIDVDLEGTVEAAARRQGAAGGR